MSLIQRAKRFLSSRVGAPASAPAELKQLQDQVSLLIERSREQQDEIDELRADSLRIAELRIQVEDRLFNERA